MSTGRRLLRGAAWIYGAQIATVVTQFAYAAVTSRLVTPAGFGAYAVALTVTGLVTLLATGGLGQTVSRMLDLNRDRLRALVSYALILGGVGGSALYFSAPFWTWLWGVDEALEPIRWLSIIGFVSPFIGLSTGLMARSGKFRQLALITVASNVMGMAVGAIAVMTWQSASSLVVSGALAQLLILGGSLFATDRQLLGLAKLKHGHGDIGFSGKLMLASFLSYLTGNITKFSLTRAVGAATLGHWNRAEVVSVIPFQHIQNALIKAAYPEFRHDIADAHRAKRVWTDMLILTAWIAFGLSACGAALIPPLVPVVFGPGWEIAASLAGPLAIAGGLQIVTTLLASGIEALGRFRWVWSTDAILISLQVGAAALIFLYEDIFVAIVAIFLTNVVRHAWQVWLAGRGGYLNVPRLLQNYLLAASVSASFGAIIWAIVKLASISGDHPSEWFWTLSLAAVVVFALFMFREKIPAVVIARRYGFIPKRSSQ